jgi:hypothetical protein
LAVNQSLIVRVFPTHRCGIGTTANPNFPNAEFQRKEATYAGYRPTGARYTIEMGGNIELLELALQVPGWGARRRANSFEGNCSLVVSELTRFSHSQSHQALEF